MSSARESRSALPAGSSAGCQAPNMRARRTAEALSTSIDSHWCTCPQVDHSGCCDTEQTEETTKPSARRCSMVNVVLSGTMHTKRTEYASLAQAVRDPPPQVLPIDVGPYSEARADISSPEVAAAAGHELEALLSAADRGRSMEDMAAGAAAILTRLHDEGTVDGVLAVGGSGGPAVASRARPALPVGVPKRLVSTMASGDVAPYVRRTDLTLRHPLVDV